LGRAQIVPCSADVRRLTPVMPPRWLQISCISNLTRSGRTSNPRVVNLGQRRWEVLRDAPLWIMRHYLGQIGNVADVIAASGRIHILVFHRFARDFAYGLEGFQDGNGVLSPASDVVNFRRARGRDEALDQPGDIDAMNVIANLLSLVAIDSVGSAFEVA